MTDAQPIDRRETDLGKDSTSANDVAEVQEDAIIEEELDTDE